MLYLPYIKIISRGGINLIKAFLKIDSDAILHKCPICGKKSFLINENDTSFLCFGCMNSGNLDYLKIKLGKPVEFAPKTENERLFALNKEAAFYFKNALNHYEEAKKYLIENRGMTQETINEFGLGYANPDWTSAKQYLMSKGYTEGELVDAGILFKSNKNGKTYDFYRGRIMFPIKDSFGRIIGFSGRILETVETKAQADGEKKKNPKYINTNENDVFHKREGFYNIEHFDATENYILLCEGQMDTIAFYTGGIANAVATLGTALTPTQACIIKSLVDIVYIAFDGDNAGESAANKAVDLLRDAGIKDIRRVYCIAGSKDPDEVLKNHGTEGLKKMMQDYKKI